MFVSIYSPVSLDTLHLYARDFAGGPFRGCFTYGHGSVDCSDWPRVDWVIDFSPGGIWIGYIRQVLRARLLTDATPVTGSVVFSALFDCLDVYCAAGFTSCRTFCSIWIVSYLLDMGYPPGRLASIGRWQRTVQRWWKIGLASRFGVELYVPWDAPEAVVDISLEGVIPLRSIPDVIGLTGRRVGAVECCVL